MLLIHIWFVVHVLVLIVDKAAASNQCKQFGDVLDCRKVKTTMQAQSLADNITNFGITKLQLDLRYIRREFFTSNLTSLSSLEMMNGELTSSTFSKMKNLKKLTLVNVSGKYLPNVFKNLQKLKEIFFSNIDFKTYVSLKNLKHLESFEVDNCKNFDNNVFNHMQKITVLVLASVHINPVQLSKFMPDLKKLWIHNVTYMKSQKEPYSVMIQNLTKLVILDIHGDSLHLNKQMFSQVPSIYRLVLLAYQRISIGDYAFQSLTKLHGLSIETYSKNIAIETHGLKDLSPSMKRISITSSVMPCSCLLLSYINAFKTDHHAMIIEGQCISATLGEKVNLKQITQLDVCLNSTCVTNSSTPHCLNEIMARNITKPNITVTTCNETFCGNSSFVSTSSSGTNRTLIISLVCGGCVLLLIIMAVILYVVLKQRQKYKTSDKSAVGSKHESEEQKKDIPKINVISIDDTAESEVSFRTLDEEINPGFLGQNLFKENTHQNREFSNDITEGVYFYVTSQNEGSEKSETSLYENNVTDNTYVSYYDSSEIDSDIYENQQDEEDNYGDISSSCTSAFEDGDVIPCNPNDKELAYDNGFFEREPTRLYGNVEACFYDDVRIDNSHNNSTEEVTYENGMEQMPYFERHNMGYIESDVEV